MFKVSVKAVGRQFSSEGTRNSAVLLRATYAIIAKIPIFKEAWLLFRLSSEALSVRRNDLKESNGFVAGI